MLLYKFFVAVVISISADVLWLLQTILTSLECSFYHGQSNQRLYCLLPCHTLKLVCSALENMQQTQLSGIKYWKNENKVQAANSELQYRFRLLPNK